MDSEKKPMDAAELAELRGELERGYLDSYGKTRVAELLAAHDYHEQRADVAERERDDMRVDLGIQVELLDSARVQRDALRAKLAEHGFPDTDPDVRRYKDHLLGVQESTAEYEVKHCENELSAALGQQTHGGWETLLSAVSNLRADVEEMERVVKTEHDGPSLAFFFIDHMIPVMLEWSVEHCINVYIGDIGENEAIAEAVDGIELSPGSYVAELALVDDGPGDWPGSRECRIEARNIRRAHGHEWREHTRGEWIFPHEDDES